MINKRLHSLPEYPFTRLASLLDGVTPPPGRTAATLSIGEPQEAPPPFVTEAIGRAADQWNRYPPLVGTDALREAAVGWLVRRFGLPSGLLDPGRHVLPLSGTREGLYFAAQLIVDCGTVATAGQAPAVLLPNPFYGVYEGAAHMAGAEPVYLPCEASTGFLPDLDALSPQLLDRTAAFYLCSPSNPQGAAADGAYWRRLLTLARRHDFVVVADECYAEIYTDAAPCGALEAAAAMDGGGLDNLLCFHSLSKRSNAAGLRSGFVVGDRTLIAAFTRLRGYGCAGMPLPIQAASAALWADDAHVADIRDRYRRRFDVALETLSGRFAARRPAGGFFLWLDVGDGEQATRRLWRAEAIKVLPGAYVSHDDDTGHNPGARYIRVALVHSPETLEQALPRMCAALDS